MENIKIVDVENPISKSITKWVIIDRGNDEFTSMTKDHYDEQQAQAALSTPSV